MFLRDFLMMVQVLLVMFLLSAIFWTMLLNMPLRLLNMRVTPYPLMLLQVVCIHLSHSTNQVPIASHICIFYLANVVIILVETIVDIMNQIIIPTFSQDAIILTAMGLPTLLVPSLTMWLLPVVLMTCHPIVQSLASSLLTMLSAQHVTGLPHYQLVWYKVHKIRKNLLIMQLNTHLVP